MKKIIKEKLSSAIEEYNRFINFRISGSRRDYQIDKITRAISFTNPYTQIHSLRVADSALNKKSYIFFNIIENKEIKFKRMQKIEPENIIIREKF